MKNLKNKYYSALKGELTKTAETIKTLKEVKKNCKEKTVELNAQSEKARAEIKKLIVGKAREIWNWVEQIHKDGVAGKIKSAYAGARYRVSAVRVLEATWDNGTKADGHTGSNWVDMDLDKPVLVFSRRTGPSWGNTEKITKYQDLLKQTPGVVLALYKQIKSGRVYELILKELAKRRKSEREDADFEKSRVLGSQSMLKQTRKVLDELVTDNQEK